ncbi:hypothetical protein KDU71_19320 [Carboxylicivirga sediminis]|uniref:Uncharacterized protein n=1 Tax=Carboxylicivirga sediminis TaxID=2006564 RepID=A0A941F9X9_9BACT|nr:hypothetical protein [Carboxylicivirga sediminis]MBR8537730.1 hypothetical protein [Carboxylicivirga sediminis]
MGILRNIKSDYEIYENVSLECVVAIERNDCKKIKAYRKKYKGKEPLPSETVEGYQFIMDEEFGSLKIDFSKKLNFEIRDLVNVKG